MPLHSTFSNCLCFLTPSTATFLGIPSLPFCLCCMFSQVCLSFFSALLLQMPPFTVSSKVIFFSNHCPYFQCNHCSACLLLFPPCISLQFCSSQSTQLLLLPYHTPCFRNFFLLFFFVETWNLPLQLEQTIIECFLSSRYRNTSQSLPLPSSNVIEK